MKKKVFVILVIGILVTGLTGCNFQMFATTYSYDKAIIKLANDEVVEVKIKKWTIFDGEKIQIIAEDGTVYLTNSFRCDLIKSVD